ncbi:GPI-anchored protein LLG1-like [Nicotiana tabacum]|uniref:GPI-anchored protein LLG1-like n=2 Tax=Nicotiana TaxID=4085 RepID=A0A1S4CC96_TOBAC|nr:PREDICTED: GPI-anchored protein LORELEI-like [Nicotiana sylvestris]XP_016498847.1 PREDICTED: GPI-anchored protein LORELEI-like [Nicotiana tabacum]
MGFEIRSCFFLFLFFLVVGLASSSPTYIKYSVLRQSHAPGRGLLQQYLVKNDCPINFEKEDYTPLTSQCKGPQYNPALCCNGFKTIACRYTNEINDESNGCATGMFISINESGKYPTGLFENICKEAEEGLKCDNVKSPVAPRQNVHSTPRSNPRVGNRQAIGKH